MFWVLVLFVFSVLSSFFFEKHLFCYFLSLEVFVFSVLYFLGFVCAFHHQPFWFLIFICFAVVESVLGLCLYLSFFRLFGPRGLHSTASAV